MVIIDGRKVSENVLDSLRTDLDDLNKKNVFPKLVIILVGEDPASLSYIRQKAKACEKLSIKSEQINLPVTVTTEEIIELVERLNVDELVHGILVQLPLPKHIDPSLVIRSIDPKKDVDGFTAYNLGKMLLGVEYEDLPPCTPMGVIKMLDYYDIDVSGMNAVVVGASNIVGKPMGAMLLNRGATVTTCHILTKNLKDHTLRADLLVVAVGKAGLINEDMVKDGAIVVDIGCNRVDGKLCGDVDFERIQHKASYITPVPGGAGPMTVACLMENTIHAAQRIHGLRS